MSETNKVELTGNLVKDVQVFSRKKDPDKKIASFTIAVNDNRFLQDQALFVDSTIFEDQLAKSVEGKLKKGDSVVAVGYLFPHVYKNKEGVNIHSIRFAVESLSVR